MAASVPALHLLCGKPATGKSTLAGEDATVMLAEDVWLAALFADQMTSVSDYVRCAAKLQTVIAPHVVSLLGTGVSVVLDFPANTVANRNWMRGILGDMGVAHHLHYLDVPDSVCLDRLRARNLAGDHPFALTDEQFWQIARHFEPPTAKEGFNVVRHRLAPAG
ncbi:AAA family ATPase [Yoonia sediminilitoris]|uniref:Putative kinase n=1 Tax=Yoonia sediminilitoris TaxID=1286148 RepID=A0A2T6KJV1_9RHOB|nr:ATP-binding protein [Yoonia sediminilitoris]PUB16225.1 putative kinase [Yoonia sediminilitoris]RCW96574.1 putative kinase [Yoonia sediminilitoris]